jgi:hypothetical protein
MLKTRLIIMAFAAASVFAQEQPKEAPKADAKPVAAQTPAAPPAAPAPSLEPFLKEYFKRDSLVKQATIELEAASQQLPQFSALQRAQDARGEIISKMAKACGDTSVIALKQDGDPECVLKPTPPTTK